MASDGSYWTRQSVLQAQSPIQSKIFKTTVITSTSLSYVASRSDPEPGGDTDLHLKLFFKCENLQNSGSFKIRGATHILSRLSDDELRKGVVSYSTGNHGQALALAANTLSTEKGFRIPTYIVLPRNCSPSKIAATRAYGAEVSFSGNTSNERKAMAENLQLEINATLIPSSYHPDILVGQGTVAVEFSEQVVQMGEEALDCILVPCGGGGLLAGTGVACRGTNTKVFGCEPEDGGADEVVRGLKEGRRIETVNSSTIADGLRGVVPDGNWAVISNKDYVEGVFSASDRQIKDAMKLLIEETKLLVEPSSAVPLAVVLYNSEFRQLLRNGWNIGIVITGGNISLNALLELFSQD